MMSNKISNKDLGGPDKRGVFFSIRSKMLVYFGSIFVITMVLFILSDIFGVPFTAFRGEYNQHQTEVFRNLNMVADLKKERLLRWIEERKDDARVLSQSSVIKSSVTSLLPIINENIDNGVKENGFLTELQREKHRHALTQHLNLVKTAYDVYDRIQIADALTGMVMASTENKNLGMDISQHGSFYKALRPGYYEIMDVNKDSSGDTLGLFISHSIASNDNEDKISAVLIMHINSDDFITPMLHSGGGLGRTGEALLVNQNTEIITTLKHPLADGTKARPLEYQIKAKPAMLAARGHEGIITAEDYRGEAVLAAYRHIRISSEIGWGLVVKRDQAEIYAPLHESVYYLIFIGIICIIIMLGIVVVISRTLSQPVRLLSNAVQQVQAGNFNVRTSINTSDELGLLSLGFNSMTHQIKNWDKELKGQVEARTQELSTTNETLRMEIIERKKAEEQIKASLREKELLIAEIYHRTRNNMNVICSLLNMQSKNTKDGKVLSILKNIDNRIRSMSLVHSKLYQAKDLSNINLNGYIQDLVHGLFRSYLLTPDNVSLKFNAADVPIAIDHAIPYGLAINEIITNSLKHAFPEDRKGEIRIELSPTDKGEIELKISDNGIGMPKGFNLENIRNTDSLGLRLVFGLIEQQLGGKIELNCKNGVEFLIKCKLQSYKTRI